MMTSLYDVFLLAVLANAVTAHAFARVLRIQQEVASVVTSLSTHVHRTHGARSHDEPSSGNLLSLEGDNVAGRGTASVVQDWSLVCQQLCGVGLGAKLCAPHCPADDVSRSLQQIRVDSSLNLYKEQNCRNLCRLQLGGVTCRCRPAASRSTDQKVRISSAAAAERNAACDTSCIQTDETPSDCRLCSLNRTEAGDDEDGSKMPDWSALCALLCRTGDGGSLCNCDLPPFFRNI